LVHEAIAARLAGDDYQARWFWLQACRLFAAPPAAVLRVAYELALAKAFDDVVTFYRTPIRDERANLIDIDCYQAKFHVDQRKPFTFQALTDPESVGASRVSLLQRLREAQAAFEIDGRRARFSIVSPWQLDPNDALCRLVSNQGGEIRLRELAKPEMGKVRDAWRQHLGLQSDEELVRILGGLRIRAGQGDMGLLRDLLNARLELAGLVPIDDQHVGYRYDDLIRKLLQRGVREFDRERIRDICKQEDLWRGRQDEPQPTNRLGIRSFGRFAEYLEDEVSQLLSLLHHFDNRYILEDRLWDDVVYREIAGFVEQAVHPGGVFDLALECHTSIAFAAGYSLDPKAGADVAPVQKGRFGRAVWRPDPSAPEEASPLWEIREISRPAGGHDVALAINVTHQITPDVELYVDEHLPSVGRILAFTVPPRPSGAAVRDGTHANRLAGDLVSQLREQRTLNERRATLHIFNAAPNGLMFFVGQQARPLGRCTTYEHDLELSLPGAYRQAMTFPPQRG
jgi:hypothetical protein